MPPLRQEGAGFLQPGQQGRPLMETDGVKGYPVCPRCGNNLCMVYPKIFAEMHLEGEDKTLYERMTTILDTWVRVRMEIHRREQS